MGTKTVVEKELKISIPDESIWFNFCEVLGGKPSGILRQINTYFDTKDHALIAHGQVMVRVREENESLEVTIKDRLVAQDDSKVQQTRERTEKITREQWERVHRGECDLTALDVDLCRALASEVGEKLYPIGSIINTRYLYPLSDGYVAELDQTEFPGGRIDYEIEVELTQPNHTLDGAMNQLGPSLEIAGIEYDSMASPKYQRFLEALRALDSNALKSTDSSD